MIPPNDSEPHVTPAQGRPAMSEDPPADTEAGFGDDAAGAVGSPAPLPDEAPALENTDGPARDR